MNPLLYNFPFPLPVSSALSSIGPQQIGAKFYLLPGLDTSQRLLKYPDLSPKTESGSSWPILLTFGMRYLLPLLTSFFAPKEKESEEKSAAFNRIKIAYTQTLPQAFVIGASLGALISLASNWSLKSPEKYLLPRLTAYGLLGGLTGVAGTAAYGELSKWV